MGGLDPGVGHRRQWRRALAAFDQMTSRGIAPDAAAYAALVSALARGRRWERAEAALAEMAAAGLTPDTVAYTAMLTALRDAGQV